MNHHAQITRSYQVEKNVPMPPRRGRAKKYPFDEMAIGDSFAVSNAEFMKVRQAITYAQRDGIKKFSLRRLPDENRCWRTA